MKVTLEIYNGGGVGCLSEECKYTKTCANHASAGDYRDEDGFTPDLVIEHGEYVCRSADQPVLAEEWRLNTVERLPANYDAFGCGSLSYKELRKRSVVDYQI